MVCTILAGGVGFCCGGGLGGGVGLFRGVRI